nr:MAG TPA: hypothetical protein [Caudoviricetes sp.]
MSKSVRQNCDIAVSKRYFATLLRHQISVNSI